MLNFCSTATRSQYVSLAYAATLPHPVYESSFWTSKEVYETSHNPVPRVSPLAGSVHIVLRACHAPRDHFTAPACLVRGPFVRKGTPGIPTRVCPAAVHYGHLLRGAERIGMGKSPLWWPRMEFTNPGTALPFCDLLHFSLLLVVHAWYAEQDE